MTVCMNARHFLWAVVYLMATPCGSAESMPEDVVEFRKSRDLCEHFRQEEPYDEERRAFIQKNLLEFCTGTDAGLAALRSKYAHDRAVQRALSGYEDDIERTATGQ